MPYTSTYVDQGKGVHKVASGIVTGLELFTSSLREPLIESRARQLRYGLIDYSDTTEMRVTPDDIRRIVELDRKTAELTPGGLVAIIAPSPLPYALARLWHTLADDLPWKSNVFHNRADALAWLRLELLAQNNTDSLEDYPSLLVEEPVHA